MNFDIKLEHGTGILYATNLVPFEKETANVVIQTDQPSKIVTAIKIGRATHRIVIQNIILAFAVKIIVMSLGAGGLATMWEAVFADVGVALLAILNAVRIQRMKFY